jgi:hypothetical protein
VYRAIVLALVLLVSYAYFYQGGGANQNSRYDLVRAIIEHRTVRIDRYDANTIDKALYKGHYYSDKAPGQPLMAVPFSAATRGVLAMIGVKPSSHAGIVTETYVDTLGTVAIPVALGALALFWVAMRLGATQGGAAFAAASFGLATPIFVYATLWWSHALIAALLIIEFALAVELRAPRTRRRDVLVASAMGLVAGWAAITEFPAAPAAALILGLGVTHAWPRRRHVVALVGLTGGLLVAAGVFSAYNAAAFGSVLHFGYNDSLSFVLPKVAKQDFGTMGFTHPKGHVIWELLFGRFRGLFPLAPVLFLVPLGWVTLIKAPGNRKSGVVAVLVPLYYVLSTSAYFYWNGGNAYGPRFLAGAIPFLCLALAPVWSDLGRILKAAMAWLAIVGVGFSLVAVSTDPQPTIFPGNPVTDHLWPAFRSGRLSSNTAPFVGPPPGLMRTAWNIGEGVGLRGRTSLVPLYVFWVTSLAAWLALARERDQAADDRTRVP